MKTLITKQFSLRKNGCVIKYYKTKSGAIKGLNALYNNGKVLPDDELTIYDKQTNCYII